MLGAPSAFAQAAPQAAAKPSISSAEQELITLSKDKWQWISERNVEALGKLFAEEAIFVHMGATMTKSQELDVIKGAMIQYKEAQIQEVSVRFVGGTGILLNKIRLVAVVGGNEVVNPFNVTEVYVKLDGAWKLASLSFTRLMTP
jgi:4-carboxymuconolactone decarboxylase